MNRIDAGFGGRVGRTFAESEPWWQPLGPRNPAAPNVLSIIFDDMGWADLGCFGSEIDTPNLDRCARKGLIYNNFHVTPLCSPTRASFLTGRNHHRVGMRFLADIDTGFPNSRGRVDADAPMLSETLRGAGYGTYLVGKWHLTPQHEITPAGPFGQWPLQRGFDRFYGFLDGCTDQFTPELCEDNRFIIPPTGDGYHLSADLADRAIAMVSDHAVFRPHDPFFMVFAPGATHAPLQAPRELIDKYEPIFAKGWDRTREDRLARQIALGLVPAGTTLTPRNPGIRAWDELGNDERRLFTRLQAAFAAFLEHADREIGRLLDRLEALGLLENTLITIFSDNGASREGGLNGTVDINGAYSGVPLSVAEQLERIDDIGGPDGPAHYPLGWAMAGNTPFRRYKQSVDLGGVRSPLVVSWSAGGIEKGSIRSDFAHVIDLGATILDCCGLSAVDCDGSSLRPGFASSEKALPRQTQYWEMFGHRAIWHDGWKAVTEHVPGTSYDDDEWRLYDTSADFAENHDLADAEPQRLADLVALWWQEASANAVLPLDDRTLVELLSVTRSPYQLVNRKRLVLRPENGHLPVSSGVTSTSRSMRIVTKLRGWRPGQEAVLVASGSSQGGYSLHVLGDRVEFEHNALGRRSLLAADRLLGNPDAEIALTILRREDGSAAVQLRIDGVSAALGTVPLTLAHPAFWGLDIGRDCGSAVSPRTAHCQHEGCKIVETVSLEFFEAMSNDELAELLAQTD
ncbi:MAG: arylsulfatase [Devosia sp.]